MQENIPKLILKMKNRQLQNLDPEKKLTFSDIKRIANYLDNDIFTESKCCIWKGYISSTSKKPGKGNYVNFYFRHKKVPLQRIIYENFIDSISDEEFLKFKCENKGKCCNMNHVEKVKYSNTVLKKKELQKQKNLKKKKLLELKKKEEKLSLTLEFSDE